MSKVSDLPEDFLMLQNLYRKFPTSDMMTVTEPHLKIMKLHNVVINYHA
jgi:hypothetical protein